MANKDFYIAKMNAALNELAWAKKGLHSDPADGDKASFTVADQLLDELLDVECAMRRSISFAELNDLNRDIGI
ncbi:hypothetical protein [Alishewanella sp. SMS8]|uniref:hypothetical protein n=1 Tax=Alishewanella sp. SMS8 TaxID=2994676 RepID=UPI0027428025|nr:hypothetical protein [Alishewanella sp. SMS8]MDP5459868.1 hypothetical protein [Alishewanella sp. SMS8]